MHTVSIRRMPSSREMIAAGTRPPRVMQTMALNGPEPERRQASARASRWNWSQETGKALSGVGAVMVCSGLPFGFHIADHQLDRRLRRLDGGRVLAADDEVG